MKRAWVWWLSGLAALILLTGLLLGFSFWEKGALAHWVAKEWGIPWEGSTQWHGTPGDRPDVEPDAGSPSDSRIGDERFRDHGPGDHRHPRVYWEGRSVGSVAAWIPTLIGIVSVVMLAYGLMKREVDRTLEVAVASPWKSLWTGLLTLLASIPVLFLLFVTIIGIPVALALMVGLAAAGALGFSALAIHTGRVVADRLEWLNDQSWKTIVLGTVLLAHLAWLPAIGWLILFAVLLIGLGSVIMHGGPRLRNAWKEWRQARKKR